MKVFLGGTCNESVWRDKLIPTLLCDYFNPVVEDWKPECQIEELEQRELCDYVLYTITPKMTGVYSIAEVVDDSNKRPKTTIFCILENDKNVTFTKGQLRSLKAVANMVKNNGGIILASLKEVANFCNIGL